DSDGGGGFGVRPGAGGAGRLHYGDSDGDGRPEYGFGVDAGPFTADVKTEDPVRTLAETALGPVSTAAVEGLTGVGLDASGKETNMTDQAVAAGQQAVGAAQAMGQDAAQAVQALWQHMTQ